MLRTKYGPIELGSQSSTTRSSLSATAEHQWKQCLGRGLLVAWWCLQVNAILYFFACHEEKERHLNGLEYVALGDISIRASCLAWRRVPSACSMHKYLHPVRRDGFFAQMESCGGLTQWADQSLMNIWPLPSHARRRNPRLHTSCGEVRAGALGQV